MRGLLLCVLACVATVLVRSEGEVDDKYVKVLSDRNFDKHTKKGTTWIVEFYAPWCGHCKNLQPVWAEAARTLVKEGAETRLAKVDATENPALTRRFSVGGYPTIKLVKDGRNRGDYTGGRTAEEIVRFARQASGSAVQNIGEGEGLYGYVGQQDITFLLIGVSSGNIPTLKAFEKIAEESAVLGSVGFATVASVSDMNEYLSEEAHEVVVEGSSLVVINTDMVSMISSQQGTKLDELNMQQFVDKNNKPFFPELSPSKNWKLTKEGKKTVLAFIDPSKAASDDYLVMMRSIKKQVADDLVVGWVDAPSHTYLLDPIGLSLETLPGFVVVDIPEMTYFKSPWLTEETEIVKYLDRVVKGKEKALPINEEKKDAPPPVDAAPSGGNTGDNNGGGGGGGGGASSQLVGQLSRQIEDLTKRVTSAEVQLAVVQTSVQYCFIMGMAAIGVCVMLFSRLPSPSKKKGE